MTYSFLNVSASIVGVGGSFSLGAGAAVAEEGIEIERNEKNKPTIGADGIGVHTLKADKSGKVRVRLLQTSPVNAQLSAMYDGQALSAATWGQNTITITDSASGDTTTCRQVAFAKYTKVVYAGELQMREWEFDALYIDGILGTY